MTDQLRTLAEAEAERIIERPVPGDGFGAALWTDRVYNFIEGFIAGRTSVTREQIVDVLVMSPLSDYAGTEMGQINRTADAVLALLSGEDE